MHVALAASVKNALLYWWLMQKIPCYIGGQWSVEKMPFTFMVTDSMLTLSGDVGPITM